jgi:glycosyltransferase involved in cell wall biosynthesis
MPNQVLFISIDGMTDQLGQSQVLPYLIGLSKKGYSISIVSCEKELNFKKNKETVFAMMTEYNIAWHYCFYSIKVPFISQLKNFFILKRLAIKEVKSKKFNILHCRSYITAFIGLQLKNKFKTKFIFDMRGFWADERIDGNIWDLRNPIHAILYKYFKRKEIELVENADYIVTLTNNAKNEIESWQLKSHLKIEVIPCCADIDHFTISSDEEKLITRSKLNIPENFFVIGYLGSIGTWYMLDEMLDFFKELQKEKPNSIFFFITNDDELGIRNVAESKGISSKCVIVKSAKREEVPAFISCFDIGLFFIKPLYSKKGSSPTKLAEILACGIPLIANTGIGDVDELLLKSNCGILVDYFNKESYVEAINRIGKLNLSKQFYRDVALTKFSLQSGIELYSTIYNKLFRE